MIYVKVGDRLYPASVSGRMADKEWDNRESKSIEVSMSYEDADALFADGTAWSIVSEEEVPVLDDEGNEITETRAEEYDNSEFSVRGDLTVHTNGTCTVKMGKETDLERAYTLLYGGIE